MEQLLLVFLAGVVVGVLIRIFITEFTSAFGELQIDTSGPEADKWRLCINKDPDEIHKKKRVVLKVVKNVNLSHE